MHRHSVFPGGASKQVVRGGGGGAAWAQSSLFLPDEMRLLEVERREPTRLLPSRILFSLFPPREQVVRVLEV